VKPAALAQIAFILVAGLAVFSFISMAKDAETRRVCVPVCAMHPNYAGRNRTAPDFELPKVDGSRVRLSQFRGKTVVLNFWTTTCQPCLEEMPSLADFGRILKNRKTALGTPADDIVVLAVSTDAQKETAMAAMRTLLRSDAKAELPFTVLLDPDSTVVKDKYGTTLYPETWIIDPSGVIRARFDGARDWSNAMVLDLIDSFARPVACGIDFDSGRASGPDSAICEEAGSS
jgi:peroxiredoxin